MASLIARWAQLMGASLKGADAERAPAPGWTDDLTIRVAPGRTLDELVDFVIAAQGENRPAIEVLEALTRRFGLSFDDARLAVDRVGGGRARAGNPSNEPDPAKDPIAYLSFRRVRGAAPAPAPARGSEAWQKLLQTLSDAGVAAARVFVMSSGFQHGADLDEAEAATLWREAIDAAADASPRGARGTCSVPVVEGLLALATLTVDSGASEATRANALLQLGVSLRMAVDACVERRGERKCVEAGTEAWFDAIALADAGLELGSSFARIGDSQRELDAQDLRRVVTTRMLGHCCERVGRVILDCARCAVRIGEADYALRLCDDLIANFTELVVEQWEASGEAPFDEHRLALQQLIAVIDVRTAIGGEPDAQGQPLRARCAALLDVGGGQA